MRSRGFTLLEIVVALAIFSFIAAVTLSTTADSDYLAGRSRRARELRLLAERKLGEILLFESHFDDTLDGDFAGDPMLGDEGGDWKWQLDVRDVTVFGISNQDDAQYLFGAPSDEEKTAASTPAQGLAGATGQPGAAKKGEMQQLRELTLKVSAPQTEGTGDSVEIVTFMPEVAARTAAK